MVRKSSVYLLLSCILVTSGAAYSLGLGVIEVDSALNQPLQAQINLISMRAEELKELRVELAPADVFDRVGIPRPYFLTQLKFEPVSLPGGRTVIRVTSRDPVREPFLTFLVEVTWPKGRLLREYTVLLDPPEFAQQRAPQVTAPVAIPAPIAEPAPAPVTKAVAAAPAESVSDDLENIRAQMDRILGTNTSESIITETQLVDAPAGVVEAEIIETGPTVEQIEEAVVEETKEIVSETVGEDVIAAEEDLDKIRAQMDRDLGIGGSEPVEAPAAEAAETEAADVVDAEPIAESVIASEYTTAKGDTLFAIARAATGSGAASVNQMMLAIQQVSPDAFIKNNINLLKSGVVLRIPDKSTTTAISKAWAAAEVSRQIALWREYRRQITEKIVAANVDAPDLVEEQKISSSKLANEAKEVLKEPAGKSTQAKQDLSIMAARDVEKSGAGATQVAGGEGLQKMQKEMFLTKELLRSRDKENDDLKGRVAALESMLEKKDKIINIQSDQLNDIKEQLNSETNKEVEAEKLLQEKNTSETPIETKLKTLGPQAKAGEIKTPVVAPLPDISEPLQAEQTITTPKLEPLPDWGSLPEIEVAVVAETETPPAEKTPEEKPETAAKTGLTATITGFIESLKMHAGKGVIGFAILAFLGGIYAWRQKRSARGVKTIGLGGMPEAMEDDQLDDILDETIVTQQDAPSIASSSSEAGVIEPTANVDLQKGDVGDDVSPDDVLEEADVYISYGLHQQAQELLVDAIAAEPSRNDYKVKLAEVYYSSKDQAAFEQHAQTVKDQLGESSSEWRNIIAMGKEIAPASKLFAGVAAVAAVTNAITEKPDVADVDVGLQTGTGAPVSDDDLEDTVVKNSVNNSSDGSDFDLDSSVADSSEVDGFEDDPVASKIMEANKTSDFLNSEVDDSADDLDADTDIQSAATGVFEATGLQEAADLGEQTEETDDVDMQPTKDDLKPLEIDAADVDDTVAFQTDDDIGPGLDAAAAPDDPEATVAHISNDSDLEDTEQFDASSMDTEFLDPAEATVAQTVTDLHELGPPSLIEEVGTKLDLAKAFVDMGDSDAAKETLLEVISEGDESQIKAAKDLMDKLGG